MIFIIIGCFVLCLLVAFSIEYLTIKIHKKKGLHLDSVFEKSGLLIASFRNGNKDYNFLIDTGSDTSHINNRIIKKFKDTEKIKSEKYEKIEVSTGNGTTLVDSTMIKIPLYYHNELYSEVFLPLDLEESFKGLKEEMGIQLHGILGNTFFKSYNFIIDFSDITVYSK